MKVRTKIIRLTRVVRNLNETGERKLSQHKKKVAKLGGSTLLKDEYGRNAEWYENQGMTIPDELIPNNQKVDDLLLVDSDYYEQETPHLCNYDHVKYIDVYNKKNGQSMIVYNTTIMTDNYSGPIYTVVKEDVVTIHRLLTEKLPLIKRIIRFFK